MLNSIDTHNLLLYLMGLGGKLGLTSRECRDFLELSFRYPNEKFQIGVKQYHARLSQVRNIKRRDSLKLLIDKLTDATQYQLFNFCLKLLVIKPYLLEKAKLIESAKTQSLAQLAPLTLAYDTVSKHGAYYVRVNAALLALLMFERLDNGDEFLSHDVEAFIDNLRAEYHFLKTQGLNANQMFMLMFSESVNQSITTSGGSSYEARIMQMLVQIGIDPDTIQEQLHDEVDSSTEFDMFFHIDEKSYGISAKRTLRERYKQFIKTAQMSPVDVMISITLGLDLTESKAKSMRNYGVYVFVADEIYQSRPYLQEMDGIYSSRDLTLETLKSLPESS